MDIVQAVILGVVEGVTEFLPISSTGHMIIVSHLLKMPQTEFLKTFEIAIQLGAIMAVAGMYWRTFLLDWDIGLKVLAAFVPTAVIGLLLYKVVKQFLLGNMLVVVWSLFIGGALLILFEMYFRPRQEPIEKLEKISYQQALIIGLFQALAVIPGVSRSAATIVGGMLLGVGRRTIVEFSFLLAVPTMMAATLLDVAKTDAVLSSVEWGILAVGFMVAFIVAWFSVKLLLRYITKYNFTPFGVYRVILALVLLFFVVK